MSQISTFNSAKYIWHLNIVTIIIIIIIIIIIMIMIIIIIIIIIIIMIMIMIIMIIMIIIIIIIRKAPFSWWTSVDGRSDCRSKTVFSSFSSVKWTLPKLLLLSYQSLMMIKIQTAE